jgi:ABC-type sulfate/molybdate transport systems ATPase subunit
MADRYPGEVSGGEARRAALARALAPGRNILLLDEPLANLQPELCAGMARWIAAELRAASAACLWVAHHPEESAGVATRVLVLSNGRFG